MVRNLYLLTKFLLRRYFRMNDFDLLDQYQRDTYELYEKIKRGELTDE